MGRSRTVRRVLAVLVALAIGGAAGRAGAFPDPTIAGRAGLVMDARTGEVIWERNGDMALPPASTTKILTAIVALESGRLDREVVVSANAAAQPPSRLGLQAGQRVRLIDLVYAVMLKSANDAAVAVAEGVAGSVPAFAARMNQRARQLGARSTHFENPHGLPGDDHWSSAHDLALMLRFAMNVPRFREVITERSTSIPVEGATLRMIPVTSHNRLLQGYAVPVYGKTGYTRAAGKCFVGAGELDGRAVIVAVLGSSNLWGDARRLVEFGMMTLVPESAARLDFGTSDPVPAVREFDGPRDTARWAAARRGSISMARQSRSRTTTAMARGGRGGAATVRPPSRTAGATRRGAAFARAGTGGRRGTAQGDGDEPAVRPGTMAKGRGAAGRGSAVASAKRPATGAKGVAAKSPPGKAKKSPVGAVAKKSPAAAVAKKSPAGAVAKKSPAAVASARGAQRSTRR